MPQERKDVVLAQLKEEHLDASAIATLTHLGIFDKPGGAAKFVWGGRTAYGETLHDHKKSGKLM